MKPETLKKQCLSPSFTGTFSDIKINSNKCRKCFRCINISPLKAIKTYRNSFSVIPKICSEYSVNSYFQEVLDYYKSILKYLKKSLSDSIKRVFYKRLTIVLMFWLKVSILFANRKVSQNCWINSQLTLINKINLKKMDKNFQLYYLQKEIRMRKLTFILNGLNGRGKTLNMTLLNSKNYGYRTIVI